MVGYQVITTSVLGEDETESWSSYIYLRKEDAIEEMNRIVKADKHSGLQSRRDINDATATIHQTEDSYYYVDWDGHQHEIFQDVEEYINVFITEINIVE